MSAASLVSILLILLSGIARPLASQEIGNYLISVANGNLLNSRTLSCRNSMGNPPNEPLYFRNGRIFNDNGILSNGRLSFILTRENEGNFKCGERTSSGNVIMSTDDTAVKLIPFPDNNLERGSFSANTGDTVTINCPVVPGACVDQYSVWWRNASNTSQVFYERSRFNTFISSNRYTLNAATFALSISSVQPSDGASDYVCDVSVLINSQDHRYDTSLLIRQSLTVFEAPAFVVTPRPVTIAENAAKNATYICKVRSSPLPSSISWIHRTDTRMTTITSSDSNRGAYHVTTERIRTLGGYQVNSWLMLTDVSSQNTGTIVCRATYEGDVDTRPLEHNTTLTVISAPIALKPRRTDEGGFFYEISLRRPLPIPVRVDLWYTDVETGREERSPSTESFYNTQTLRIFRNSIPFQTSVLSARIVYGDEDIVGPFFNGSIFERRKMDFVKMAFYIGGGFVISILIVLVIVIWVLSIIISKFWEKLKKPECRMGIDLQSNCSRQRQSSQNVNSTCNVSGEGPISQGVHARSIRGGVSLDNQIRLQEELQPSPNVHYYREHEIHLRGGIGPERRPPVYSHASPEAHYYRGNEEPIGTGKVPQGGPPAYLQALQNSKYYNGGVILSENGIVLQEGAAAHRHTSQRVRYDGSEMSVEESGGAEAVSLEMGRLDARVIEGTSEPIDSDTSRITIDNSRIVVDSGASPQDEESLSPNEDAETTSSDSMSSSVFFRVKKLLLYICCCVSRSRVLYNHKQGVSEQSADVYLENLKRIIKFAVKDAMIGEKMKQAKYQPLVEFANSDE